MILINGVFHPTDVFAILYRAMILRIEKQWLQELSMHSSDLLSINLGKLIETQFALSFHENLDSLSDTSAAAHLRLLKKFHPQVGRMSTLCSMMCLQRLPEHKLPCEHAVCDTCIQIHQESNAYDPWLFEMEECPLCHLTFTPRIIIKMHNPARGFRVLCLDGGGCRGIIPLKLLQALEDRIGLPLPVQQNFDMFLAPSSGEALFEF